MGETEESLPPSKKRAAGRELNRDRPELDDEEDTSEAEGTFKKASNEVLATRRIVKVRRNQTTSSAPSSNPFAAIRLVPPSVDATAKPADVASAAPNETSDAALAEEKDASENEAESKVEKAEAKSESKVDTEEGNEKDNQQPEKKVESGEGETESAVEKVDAVAADKKETDETSKPDEGNEDEPKNNESAASVSSFQQLSSTKNAFTGFSGTGFSTTPTFSFGLAQKDGSSSDQSSPFSFSTPTNGNSSSLFSGSSTMSKPEGSGFPSKEEVVVETGEENEKVVFSADSVLFEFTDGSWKERGKGGMKVNVSTESEKARLVMRTKGNYRLILNALLYPEMKLTNMDKKGITFACVNSASEGKHGSLATFAAKFKEPSIVESFREAVNSHKGKEKEKADELFKTPETSPKASED